MKFKVRLFVILSLFVALTTAFLLKGFQLSSTISFSYVKIGIDTSHMPNHITFDDFINNYTSAGNDVFELDNLNNIDQLNALLIPGSRTSYTDEELNAIAQWFHQGHKLLFITADSDYSGIFQSDASLNPLLRFLNSSLRFDSGAVADAIHNDGMSYRVIATQPGNGTIGSQVNIGITQILLHGPTTVFGVIDGQAVDLRNTTIPNVEILFSYSNDSQILDQDVSEVDSDFYFYHTEKQGDYPAVVAEKMNNSYLLLAGECLFTDYKYMFGTTGEHGTPIDNHYFTIRLLNYFYELYWKSEITTKLTTTTTNTSTVRFDLISPFVFLAFGVLALVAKRKMKN